MCCSVQQRRYRPGLALSWHNRSGDLKEIARDNLNSNNSGRIKLINASNRVADLSTGREEDSSSAYDKAASTRNEDSCDILVFRSGKQIKAKVLLYANKKVRFYPCDAKDGQVAVVYSSDLSMIKYANGDRVIFKKEKQNRADSTRRRLHPLAFGPLVAGILGITSVYMPSAIPIKQQRQSTQYETIFWGAVAGCLLIGSIVIMFLVIRDTKRQPDKYKSQGAGIAKLGGSLSMVYLSLFFLGILLVVLLS